MTERVELSSEKICDVEPKNPLYIDDETLLEGESEIITYPKNGLKSRAFITIISGDKKETKVLRKDYYRPIQAVIKKGVKKPPLDSIPEGG